VWDYFITYFIESLSLSPFHITKEAEN
jgi:hypothetical protein